VSVFKSPSVEIRAEGSNGYVVVYRGVDGKPTDLRRLETRQLANQYRDGVAEGLYRASCILSDLEING
jgi:hypothetical protein